MQCNIPHAYFCSFERFWLIAEKSQIVFLTYFLDYIRPINKDFNTEISISCKVCPWIVQDVQDETWDIKSHVSLITASAFGFAEVSRKSPL